MLLQSFQIYWALSCALLVELSGALCLVTCSFEIAPRAHEKGVCSALGEMFSICLLNLTSV